MARAERFSEATADFWTQQVGTWMESVAAGQKQMERLGDVWMDQTLAFQGEGLRFVREWMETASKGQAELWKAWQENLKAGAGYLGANPFTEPAWPAPKKSASGAEVS